MKREETTTHHTDVTYTISKEEIMEKFGIKEGIRGLYISSGNVPPLYRPDTLVVNCRKNK